MTQHQRPDFILAGVGKAGTTWIYECLKDHPDVAVPDTDSLNFFDLNYHRGLSWYQERLPEVDDDDTVLGEATPGYLIDPFAPERIAEYAPDATLLFCLRDPVDRAFSLWWHGYSDRNWTYEFEEMFDFTPPYQLWVVPGFYAHFLRRFDEHFDEEQMEIYLFEDMVADNASFIREIYETIGVRADYTPWPIGQRVNDAHYQGPNLLKRTRNWVRFDAPEPVGPVLEPFVDALSSVLLDRSRYEAGVDQELRRQLEEVYHDDIVALSSRLDRDLDHWFEQIDPSER
jgi:hypothetical protein